MWHTTCDKFLSYFVVRMGLPEKRISELVKRAMRAVPMPADPNPVDIAYEDADLIAVVKPPGKAWHPQSPVVTRPVYTTISTTFIYSISTYSLLYSCSPGINTAPVHR